MNEKTPLEILDVAEGILKKKKQARYLSIAGFSFLLAHAFTHVPILLVMALALFGVSIYWRFQVRGFSNRAAKDRSITPIEPDQNAVEEKTTYVFESNNIVSSVSLQFDSAVYELTFSHEKADWEGDDILLCKSHDGEVNIHPATFLKYLESSDCDYLHNQDQSFIESLKDTACLKFGYLEDSRDYPTIIVAGDEVSVKCKYLCPILYIINSDQGVTLIVDELLDLDGEEIPAVITRVKESIFRESTAEFSVEDDAWIQI